MPRTYVRRFDHEEARARHAAGETVADLAREYGVSWTAVKRVVDADTRERMHAKSVAYIMSGVCPDCGKTGVTRKGHGGYGRGRCMTCAAKARAFVTDTEARCVTCKQWKPHLEFTKGTRGKNFGGLHSQCRECQTAARRDYRRRHRDEDRAYNRTYKARRRAERKAA